MEVCVDSLESTLNAFHGGAQRIELCSSLNEGGLTPTYGLFKSIRSHLDKLDPERRFKINCMIRSRPGDFNYTDLEMETMMEDASKFVELEADGLVFGALDVEGNIDEALVREIHSITRASVKMTFHRAFDVCRDWRAAFEKLNELRFDWILTSGQKKSAFEGRETIAELVKMSKQTPNSVKILAGCGINSSNLEAILSATNCEEFHASAKSVKRSNMVYKNLDISMGSSEYDEYSISYSSQEKIKELVDIYNKFHKK